MQIVKIFGYKIIRFGNKLYPVIQDPHSKNKPTPSKNKRNQN